jgi:hypothetical protein
MPLFRRGSGGGGGGSGTVSGTPGKVAIFAAPTVAGNSAFIAEDANGVNVTGGNLNSTQGSLASMARGGAGHIGAICLNNTSGSRAETVLTGQALLTGDFSAYTKVKLPDINPSANQYIWSIFDPSSADTIFVQIAAASSRLDFVCKKTGETTLTLTGSTTLYSQLLGQVIGIGVKRVGNVVTFYINGVSVGTLTGNACLVSYSASAKSQAGNLASSATPFLGNIYANRIYNRALSDADFAAIGSGGVGSTDEYGSQTPTYTSDFSAGVDGWITESASQVTLTGNTTDPGSVVATLKCERTAAGSGRMDINKASVGLTAGKSYRAVAYVYNENYTAGFFAFSTSGLIPTYNSASIAAGSSGTLVCEFTADVAAGFRFGAASSLSSGNAASVPNGTKYYLKSIVVTQIGCISAPTFNIGTGTNLPDRSPNGLDATITGGYTHTIPVRSFNVIDKLRLGAVGDWVLTWVSAGVAAIRNGAVGQALRINGTYTDDSNQRYLDSSNTTAGAAKVNSKGIGTGVSGNTLDLAAGDVTGLRLNSAGGAEGPLGTLTRTHAGDVSAILPSATAGSRVEATLARHAIGTGDFAKTCRVEVPASNPSAEAYIMSFNENGSNQLYLSVNTSGVLRITSRLAGSAVINTVMSGFITAYAGQVVFISAVRSGTSVTVYLNGFAVATVTDATIAVSYSTAAQFMVGNATSSAQPWTWRAYNARLFRRALSASDVVYLMNKGIDPADEWDNPTAVWTSNFSAGSDGVTAGGGTAAGNIDSIGGLDNNERFTVDGANTSHYLVKSNLLTVGKRYRLTASVFIPTGQSNINSVSIDVAGAASIGGVVTTLGSWVTVSGEFVSGGASVYFYGKSSGGYTFTGNGTDLFYVRGITVEQIGCVLDWALDTGVGLCIPDRSSNCYMGQGTGISHPRQARYGEVVIRRQLLASEISTVAATTKLFDLPANCGIIDVELDKVAMDAGITINIGKSGTPARYASAMAADTNGLLGTDSLFKFSESSTADTAIYAQKSGATTVGSVTIKIRFVIRG